MASNRKARKRLRTPTQKEAVIDSNSAEVGREYIKLYGTLLGAFLFSCVCTGVIWYLYIREPQYSRYVSVPVVTLDDPNVPFASDVIKRQEPVVIRNSVISKWRATKQWSPKYLQSKIPVLTGIYENDNRWFGPYYNDEKPLTEKCPRKNKYITNLTLSGEEFFSRIQNPVRGRYHYFTGDIDQLGGWAISDVDPIQELLSPYPTHTSVNVWMGQPNVIAHCHYDGYHNFYAQLYGTKKFTMFRPSTWQGLYPFPFLHPSHAQAQVNLSEWLERERYPLVRRLTAHEVVLQPGDLLYMPPLWFHHVESLSVSISVNVWTATAQSDIMKEMFTLSLPFDEVKIHGINLRGMCGGVVLDMLVEKVCSVRECAPPPDDHFKEEQWTRDSFASTGSYFVYRLWSTRYRRLMEGGELDSTFRGKRSLLCEDHSLHQLFAAQGMALSTKLRDTDIQGYIERVVELIRELPTDTWELWFGNYAEFIAFRAVDAQYVGLFLQHYNTCTKYFNL